MSSPTALLLDCMSAAAGHVHGCLSWSSLVISPRLLLVETRTDNITWCSNLTAAWQHDPTTAGLKLRFRPSSLTKQPFAQVQATAAKIAAVRARKGHAPTNPSMRNPSTLQATITMPLATCGPIQQWLPAFMQKVATVNTLPLQETTTESGLDVHKWKPIVAYDGSWSGKVLVQLASAEQVRRLHTAIHGQGVEVQHHLAGITVDSTHLDLGTRNARPQTQHS